MAHSSPEGIILGKGSTLQSLDLSINKEKVLSIKQQDKKLYSEEEVRFIAFQFYYEMSRYMKVPSWYISDRTVVKENVFKQFKKK